MCLFVSTHYSMSTFDERKNSQNRRIWITANISRGHRSLKILNKCCTRCERAEFYRTKWNCNSFGLLMEEWYAQYACKALSHHGAKTTRRRRVGLLHRINNTASTEALSAAYCWCQQLFREFTGNILLNANKRELRAQRIGMVIPIFLHLVLNILHIQHRFLLVWISKSEYESEFNCWPWLHFECV